MAATQMRELANFQHLGRVGRFIQHRNHAWAGNERSQEGPRGALQNALNLMPNCLSLIVSLGLGRKGVLNL